RLGPPCSSKETGTAAWNEFQNLGRVSHAACSTIGESQAVPAHEPFHAIAPRGPFHVGVRGYAYLACAYARRSPRSAASGLSTVKAAVTGGSGADVSADLLVSNTQVGHGDSATKRATKGRPA